MKDENEEIEVYSVDDQNEVPIVYEDIESALECIKNILDGIDYGYEIKVIKKKMTRKEYEKLPEL